MSSLFLMSWILWKSTLCILRALFIVLVACLLDYKGLLHARNVCCGSWLRKKRIHKAQRVFQGFKDWGSLSAIRLLMSFIFSFTALLWFALFFIFYCFARAYSFYLGCHFFLVIWACPLAFEFLELLYLFWLSHSFFSFLIEIFSCPLVWGVILVGIFFMKEKLFRLKKGS